MGKGRIAEIAGTMKKSEDLLIKPRKQSAVSDDAYDALFGPVKNKRTFEEVSDRLKELIFNGTLKPGQQLPSETALAQLFQVGRQSVREALRILELSGFINVRSGKKGGAVIEETIMNKLSMMFLDAIKFKRLSLDDFIDARRAVELAMFNFVFKNCVKKDIENFRENIEKAKLKLERGVVAYEENVDFHRLLARTSKNYIFCLLEESILAIHIDFKSKLMAATINQSMQIVLLHEQIVDALAMRKKKEAVAYLNQDLSAAKGIFATNTRKLNKNR